MLAFLAVILAVGCSAGEPSAMAPEGAPPAAPDAGARAPTLEEAQSGRKLVYSADVTLRGTDPWRLAEEARLIPTEMGGDLLSLEQSGEGDGRSARLSMRVPAQRFEEALARLRQLEAEVVSSRIDTKDVTDQLVDLGARLASKQREEQQYLSLLARATTVDDTLKVSQALGSVRTEIEQIAAQLDALQGRIDYSTITVSIDNVADLTTQSAWQPVRTVVEALVALVSLLKFLGDLAIWLVIVGWVPALLVLAFIRLRSLYRRLRPRTPPSAAAPVGSPTSGGERSA